MGPGGGLYMGPGGGLYKGLSGGLYTGPDSDPYMSNWPPREYLLRYMIEHNLRNYVEYMISCGF